MRLSADRIRKINRSIARSNGIVCGAPDKTFRPQVLNPKTLVFMDMASVVKVVAVPRSAIS